MKKSNAMFGPTILRVFIGFLFIIPGFMKLFNPEGIIGMLAGLGFPAAGFFGWLVLLTELLFGGLVLLGWKLRWTIWPLFIVLLVAILVVHLPALSAATMGSFLFHVLGLAVLLSLFFTGGGRYALR